MTATYAEATDAINTVFKTVWDPRAVVWDEVGGDVPATDVIWARTQLRHLSGSQATLADSTGQTRYDRAGVFTAQIFSPAGDGAAAAVAAAQEVVDAYVQNSGTIWYRNVQLREVGKSGPFFQVNVLVNFEYQDIK